MPEIDTIPTAILSHFRSIDDMDALRVELLHRLANALAHWDAKERTHDIPWVTCPAVTLARGKALVTAGERIAEGSDIQYAQ